MILIIGANGSMGRRYRAIFSYLGIEFQCVDKEHSKTEVRSAAKRSDGIVIATPTDTHAAFIRDLCDLRKPLLSEKPVVKDTDELRAVVEVLKDTGTPFRMMYQYSMLARTDRIGPSLYNYFRHGNDGLVWDCMQIIGLARASYVLRESAPVWSCKINGQRVELQHMDAAYIAYIQKWLREPFQDLGEIYAIHEKTHAAAVAQKVET